MAIWIGQHGFAIVVIGKCDDWVFLLPFGPIYILAVIGIFPWIYIEYLLCSNIK
jgi:hypothetical protein